MVSGSLGFISKTRYQALRDEGSTSTEDGGGRRSSSSSSHPGGGGAAGGRAESRGRVLLRFLCFCCAFLAVSAAFAMFAFTVYLNALKSQLHFTQSQVEMFMSLQWLGLGATLPCTPLIQKVGVRVSALLAGLLSGGAYLLIWSALMDTLYYSQHYPLIAFYFLLAGCGGGMNYLIGLRAIMGNYKETVRCTMISIVSSATSISPMIFIAIYGTYFANNRIEPSTMKSELGTDPRAPPAEPIDNPKRIPNVQDVAGYFMLLAIFSLVTCVLCVIFYGEYPPAQEASQAERSRLISEGDREGSRYSVTSDSGHKKPLQGGELDLSLQTGADERYKRAGRSYDEEEINDSEYHGNHSSRRQLLDSARSVGSESDPGRSSSDKVSTPWHLLKSYRYHCLLWPSIILLGMGPMIFNNLNTFLLSFDLIQYSTPLAIVGCAVGIVGKLLLGWICDLFAGKFPRSGYVVISCAITFILYVFSIFFLHTISVIGLNMLIVNGSCVAIWCIVPSMLIEEFGEHAFMFLWGLINLGYGITAFTFQYMFGLLYDMHVEPGTTDCYGEDCFTGIFIISTVLMFISTVMSFIYMRKRTAIL